MHKNFALDFICNHVQLCMDSFVIALGEEKKKILTDITCQENKAQMVFDQKINGNVRKNFMATEHTALIILIKNRFRTDLFL